MKTEFLFCSLVSILFGCQTLKYPPPDYFEKKICSDNTVFFVKDSMPESLTYYTKENNRYLNLKQISIPSDTFYFRVEYYTATANKIFEYSFYKSKETFKIFTFPLDPKDQHIVFDNKKDDQSNFVEVFSPYRKHDKFLAQLETCKIFELPNCHDILGYPSDERKLFLIEYSYKCRYNIIHFHNPYKFRNQFAEVKHFTDFMDYLKNDFGF